MGVKSKRNLKGTKGGRRFEIFCREKEKREKERTFRSAGTKSTYNILCAVCLTANPIREAITMTQQFV